MISGILQPAIFLNQKKFKVVSQIGEGGFAFVYQVRSVNKTDRNELYAIKKMICQSEEQLSLARKEIEVLTKLDHKNVMPLLDSSYGTNKYDQEEFLLLFPLFKCSVQTIIDKGKGFPQCGFSTGADVVKVLRQSAQGLAAIHAGGYRHADIKPGNVLINANFDAVITDFGSVSPIREVINNHSEALIVQERAADYSTASYRAPELLMTPNDCVIDGKADIWSFGCLMFAMIFSRTPFETPQEGLSTLAILSANYSCPDKHIWPMEYLDLIRDCLKVPTTGRLDITELIERLDTLCDAPNDLTAPAEEASVDDTESGSIHSTDPSITQLPIPISFGGDHPVSEEKNSEATCIPIQSNPTTALADSSNHVDDHGMDPANVSASGMDANHAITKDSSLIHLAIDSKQDNFSSGTASLCNSPTNQNQGIEDNYYKVGNDFANFENMPAPELLVIQEDNIFDVEASESIEFGEFTAVEMPSLEEEESKVKSSIALKSSSVTQREVCEVDLHAIIEAQAASIGGIVKQSKVWLMRLGGFPKKMAKKQAKLIMTKSGLIIEKDSGKDGDGKIYGIFSLHRPIHLTPSDTLSIGLNGVVLQGSSPRPLVSRRNMDSSAVGKNTVMESVDDDWITVNYHNTGHDLPAKETVSQILSNNTSPTNASVGSGNFEMAKDKDSDADQNKTASKLFRSQFSELRIEISFESKDVMGDWIDAIEAQAELLSTI